MKYAHMYILDGKKPVPEPNLFKWGKWVEENFRVVVAKTQYLGYEVSTIFLALDHNFLENGKPLLFETMVFPFPMTWKYDQRWDHKFSDIQKRYSTWKEAEIGHRKVVAKIIKEA